MQADFKVYLILTGKKVLLLILFSRPMNFGQRHFGLVASMSKTEIAILVTMVNLLSFMLLVILVNEYVFSLAISEEILKSDSIKAQQGIIRTEITYLFEEVYKLKQKLNGTD